MELVFQIKILTVLIHIDIFVAFTDTSDKCARVIHPSARKCMQQIYLSCEKICSIMINQITKNVS